MENTPQPWRLSVIRKKPEGSHAVFGLFSLYLSLLILLILIKSFAGGHAGPNDHNDPEWQDNVLIARDVRFAKTSWKYAGAPFAWYRFSTGMKTVTGIYEENGKYKMVCFQAESLPGEHVLATYSHSIFRPVVPVKELFERLLKVGVTQHYAIVDGDWRAELAAFAEIMGFEFYDIR